MRKTVVIIVAAAIVAVYASYLSPRHGRGPLGG